MHGFCEMRAVRAHVLGTAQARASSGCQASGHLAGFLKLASKDGGGERIERGCSL